jgi:hypothetical protein
MRLATAITLHVYGTSSGVEKAWDARGRGRKQRPTIPNLNRSALSKANYVPVTADKIRAAGDSVKILAAAIGGVVSNDNNAWDILKNGTKVGIEVKRFMPGRKNMKATIHSGDNIKGARSSGSRERKIEFADNNGMKRMYLVVHDTTTPGKEAWYVRRVGNKGDPRSDPDDPRTGWSYNTYAMQKVTLNQLKGFKW